MKPSVGRIVRYFPTTTDGLAAPDEGCAALIVRVWSDVMVNLTVFDAAGNTHSRTSVGQRREGVTQFCWDWPERS